MGQVRPFDDDGAASLVLDAVAAMSAESAPEQLLARFLRLCLETTGADQGAVVLQDEGQLMVRARGAIGEPVTVQAVLLANAGGLPRALIQDAFQGGEAPLSQTSPPEAPGRSSLALPVLREGRPLGVLLLQGTGLPADALVTLRLLSTHFASALEKSELLERLTREVKQRQRAEANLRFVAEASTTLAESLDYEESLARVMRLAVPYLADWCMIDLLDDAGIMRRVAVAHRDPAMQTLLLEMREKQQQEWGSQRMTSEVLAAGRSVMVSEMTEQILERYITNPEVRALVRQLGISSGMTVPLLVHGRAIGAMSYCVSTSDRRYGPVDLALAEELARRGAVAIDNARLYKEAQQAVAVRDEFLSVASHELNTPITSLQMLVDGMGAGGGSPAPEAVARTGQLMARQVGRLGRLVRELLDVQRIQAGVFQLSLEAVDLVAVVKDLAARMAEDLVRAGCAFTLHAPDRLPGRWDPSRVEQMLTNLLSNAVKFGRGQPITVTVEEVPANRARLVVADQGIGIPPERLPRIFDRFERAVPARSYGGLGLGLYIVQEIVKALGGTVTAESTPGRGATFTVELPRAPAS